VSRWSFLTNHGHVLVYLSRNPEARFLDLAREVGITERAAQRIVADLEAEGYVTRTREGRRNRYALDRQLPFRHPLEREHQIGELLETLGREKPR
jgi:DNA-binding MarR family transcriptional regulator